MKKRAKQLAMLGLTVTMMCGTQMTAFASGLGEEAPVAIETEAKAIANEETEEEVVTGTEVMETPRVEKVAGTEELVGMGVSVEAETEAEAPAEKTEAETDADTDAVPTPAPQADVEATTDTNTEATEPEAEEQADAEVTGEIANVNFPTMVDDVITVTDKDFYSLGNFMVADIPVEVRVSTSTGSYEGFGVDTYGSPFGVIPLDDEDGDGVFTSGLTVSKDDLIKEGGTKTYTCRFNLNYYYDNENGYPTRKELDREQPQITVKYVADDNGNNGGTVTPEPEKDGWIKTEEGWKYYENGQKVTGWKAVSEKWYYFNEDGIMETGWVSVGGHWYYLNSSGAMETGWTSVGSHWYYLNADGTMETGWVSVGSHWYYLNADGSMATGWVSVGGHWYYLNADGTMATGWVSVGGHWYYLNTDGTMATGWASVGGHWYYLNEDGTMASNQWIDGWYVDASGKML